MTTWLCCRESRAEPGQSAAGKLLCLAALPEFWGQAATALCPAGHEQVEGASRGEDLAWSHQHFAGLILVQQSAGAETLPQQK